VLVTAARRLLLVHAHPDDESINNAATMARYVAEGDRITLVTCTLGELGEILEPRYAGLASDRADQLGGYRISELATAMKILGVTDQRFLGRAGRWRDSGMIDTPGNTDPRAFWRCASDPAAFDEAVNSLVEVIREVRPQVLVTYNETGGYGHPDHIMAHRVALAAVDRAAAGDVAWSVAKVYYNAVPKSLLQELIDAEIVPADALSLGDYDKDVTTVVDGRAWLAAKVAALRAHRTQIDDDSPFLALSRYGDGDLLAVEHYRLVRGEVGSPFDADGHETDLFAGVTT
jgi:N-acetyl-1-D-myo-inositol-2-amino-2-deoxy-alpha-D-glucopyranoside deacetylase